MATSSSKLQGRSVLVVHIYRCRVVFKSAPKSSSCNINRGKRKRGAFLNLEIGVKQQSIPYALYTVGPFAFESSRKHCKNNKGY
uniref:Uncharacterized protein n=1 Tax=Chenopodium quinoa TaxID=63459 RepID=A0A803LPZ6_CHEQI